MALAINVTDSMDLIYWDDVFAVLGVRRCQPLLAAAGVPAVMADTPEGLVRAAHHYFAIAPTIIKPVTWTRETFSIEQLEAYQADRKQELLTLLEQTFALLNDFYEEIPTLALYDWAVRHFVDYRLRNCWSTWSQIFLRLIEAAALFYPLLPLELSPKLVRKIKAAVRKNEFRLFVNEEYGRNYLVKLVRQARQASLSPWEKGILALTPVEPDDATQTDEISMLTAVIRYECAYQLVNEFKTWMSAAEWEQFAAWGSKQELVMGHSTAHVFLST